MLKIIATAGLSFVGGIFTQKYYNLKNTPENVRLRLEQEKQEHKRAAEEYKAAKKENDKALKELENRKEEYQQEIYDEVRKKVYKEYEDYISEADDKYEKAREQNDMAGIKLELTRRIERDIKE